MSASHTDITPKAHTDGYIPTQPCVKASGLNLHDILLQNMAAPVLSYSDAQSFIQQNVCPDIGGTSLSQLMSEHVQKSKAGVDTGQALGVPSLSTLAIGTNSPPSIMTNQNSLSLGTLASLNISSPSRSSAPSLLSVPLSCLSLNNSKITTASSTLAPPPGFMSLSSVLGSSQHTAAAGTGVQAKMTDPKGSPSLADLIQEHSNRSPAALCNSSTIPQSSTMSVKSQRLTPPAKELSLSELASQHQNRNTHIQSQGTEKPANLLWFPEVTNITPACLGGTVSLSQLALQHQANSLLTSPHLVSAEASVSKQPPGISLLDLTSAHKDKTSTTSNGSHYSLSSFLSPAKSEKACVLAESTTEGGTNHKTYHQKSRPPQLRQTIDLSTLMAQSEGASSCNFNNDLAPPSSLTPASLGLDSSVFARPSVFAITLSIQSHRLQKRKKNILVGKTRGQRTASGYQAFLCKSLDKCKEQPTPLAPIAPFRFDRPSPDDIVRANQQKAFTR